MLRTAIRQATIAGWHLDYALPGEAVFSSEPSQAGGASFHLINIVLSLITCGLWLPVYIVLTVVDAARAPGRQILILTEDQYGNVTQEVRRG
jgi:hypothetical protein